LQDIYVKSQIENTDINSEVDCISGTVNGLAVLAGGINAQSLAEDVIYMVRARVVRHKKLGNNGRFE